MIAIALPMVVSNACDTVMIVTDRLFLARIDPELMNASMGGGLTAFMMMSFFIGLINYSTALVAQYLGAGRKEQCAKVTAQAFMVSVVVYPLVFAALPLAFRLFEFMGVTGGQIGPQKLYLSILLYGVIFSLLRISLSGFFTGIGRTRIVMTASIIAMATNIFFNYILIFGKFGFPALGIAGAALGTIMGGAVGVGVLAAAYFRERNRREFGVGSSFRFDKPIMGKLLSFGSPAGWEMLLNLVAFNVLVMMFHSHSPVTATAATVMFNWDLVSFVPLVGIEIGVTSLVGRYMGARQPDIAHRAVMSGFKMGLVFSAVILILFVGFPRMLVMMFQPAGDDALFAAAVPLALFMLRLASLYVLVEAVLIVFIGALRGAGDTHWAMRISVALHWLMVLVLYVILRVLHLSPEAGWASIVVIFMVFSGVVYLRYHSGAWRKIRVVEHAEPEVPIMPPDTYHEQAEL